MPRKPDPWPPFAKTLEQLAGAAEHDEALQLMDRAASLLEEMRDRELLDAIAQGHTQEEIGTALGVSKQAISQQVATARRRELRRAEERRRKLARRKG